MLAKHSGKCGHITPSCEWHIKKCLRYPADQFGIINLFLKETVSTSILNLIANSGAVKAGLKNNKNAIQNCKWYHWLKQKVLLLYHLFN